MTGACLGCYEPFFQKLCERYPILSDNQRLFQFQLPPAIVTFNQENQETLESFLNVFPVEESSFFNGSLMRIPAVYRDGLDLLSWEDVEPGICERWERDWENFQKEKKEKHTPYVCLENQGIVEILKWKQEEGYVFEEEFSSEEWIEEPVEVSLSGQKIPISNLIGCEEYKFVIKIGNMGLYPLIRGTWFHEKAWKKMVDFFALPPLLPEQVLIIQKIEIEMDILLKRRTLLQSRTIDTVCWDGLYFMGIPIQQARTAFNRQLLCSPKVTQQILGVLSKKL